MLIELSRSALRTNYQKLYTDFSAFERAIDSMADASEDKINKEIFSKLRGYSADLGMVRFKNRQYNIAIKVDSEKSHGKKCQMMLPLLQSKLKTELGDLIVAVDHILIDQDTANKSGKIINGTCSVIQTKKENYAKKGLSARQLYLMTQWPEFQYKKHAWEFSLFSDISSFYLFILDPTSPKKRKTSMLSAAMLIRLLGTTKAGLLQKVSFLHFIRQIRLPSLIKAFL